MRDFWREPKHLQKRLGRVCCIAFGGARREGNFPTKFDDTTEDTGDNAYEGGGSEAAAYRIGHGFERYSDLFFRRVKGVHDDVSYSLRVIECVVRRLPYGSTTRKSIEHHIKPQKP